MKQWAGLGALLILMVAIIFSTLLTVRYQPQADEGRYLLYAQRVAERGPGVFPRLFQDYLHGPQTNAYLPSPGRLVPILLAAVAVFLSKGTGFLALSLLSIASFLVLAVIVYFGVLRVKDAWTAFWCAVLVGTAPLHLAMSRRALSDTFGSMLFIGSLFLLFETLWRLEPSRKRWFLIAALYTVVLLTKESLFLLVPISLFFIAVRAVQQQRWPGLLPVMSVTVIPAAAALFATVAAAGGLNPLLESIRFGQGAFGSHYVQIYLQGPWSRYLIDFILISPWPLLFYFVWLGVLIGGKNQDPQNWFWVLVPILFIAGAAFFPLRNARYLMSMEVPLRMAVVFLAGYWVSLSSAQSRRWVVTAVLLAIVFMDLRMFSRFVAVDLYETPTIEFLLLNRILIPQ